MTTPPTPAASVPDKRGHYWIIDPWNDAAVVRVFSDPQGYLWFRYQGSDKHYWVSDVDPTKWLCPCLTPAEQVARLGRLIQQQEMAAIELGFQGAEDLTAKQLELVDGIRLAATALGLTLPAEGGR